VSSVYPEHNWLPLNFKDHRIKTESVEFKLELLSKKLNIKEPTNWYNVTQDVYYLKMNFVNVITGFE
jgi:hypothetical protein